MALAVPIPAVEKRGFLDEIAQGAKRTSLTLQEAIRAAKSSIGGSETFRKGRILVSTGGSGQSGSFHVTTYWNQNNVFGMLQEFLEILNDAVADGATDTAEGIDAIYAIMVQDDRLRGIRSQMGDFTGLNFPATTFR